MTGRSRRGLSEVAVFMVAWLGSLVHVADAPLWRSDRALLSVLAEEPVMAGSVSATLAGWGLGVPLGSLPLRAALAGCLGLGVAAWSVYRLSLRLLGSTSERRTLDRVLAMAAAWGVAFSFPWITEATTVAGGAAWGAAFALSALDLAFERPRLDSAALGVLMGLCVAEAPWCGLALVIALLLAWPMPSRPEHLLGVGVTAALVLFFFWAPALLTSSPRELAEQPWFSPLAVWPAHSPLGWLTAAGLLWCAGLVAWLTVARRRGGWMGLPVLAFIGLDWMLPGTEAASWTQALEPDVARTSLHLAALATIAPLGAAGLAGLLDWAKQLELPGQRALVVLLGVFCGASTLAGMEDAHRSLSHLSTRGSVAFTDAALADLRPGALVLVHSPELGRHLLAAQRRGQRPDVLVVPQARLARAGAVTRWLEAEPALETLIRDLSINPTPSERAMSLLAAERPVYVEANASWDPRLLEHLAPQFPLARFFPHALGRSDRALALDAAEPRLLALDREVRVGLVPSAATAAMLERQVAQLSDVLERIGDSGARSRLLEMRSQPTSETEGGTSSGPS